MNLLERRLKAILDVLLDSMNDAVTCIDREGVVTHWNHVAEQIYGISRDHIVGRRIGEFFQKGSVMLLQVMDTGLSVRQVYHQPSPETHVLINAVPIRDEEGHMIGAVAIEQDVSHNVKLSAERYNHSAPQSAFTWGLPFRSRNTAVQKLLHFLSQAVRHSSPILLVGEAGVGKNMLAKMLHEEENHFCHFCTISCTTLPNGLLEMELFGYQTGVFGDECESTGRPGKLELAQNGTLYIKDIHRMPLATQEKLAQTLAEKQFYRVGGTVPTPLRCRIVASSSDDIELLFSRNEFLRELYYSFHLLRIPSLRQRKEDLPELCHLYLTEIAQTAGKPAPRMASEVLATLTTYEWPGNLQELRHAMEDLILRSDNHEIVLEDLPPELRITTLTDLTKETLSLPAVYEEIERSKIADALKRTSGNKSSAARLLGISRGSLYYKIKQYSL